MYEREDEIECIVLGRRWVKAAVIEHPKCQRCGSPIKVGQSYTRVAVLVDGEFWIEKHHTYPNESECSPFDIYEELSYDG